MRDAVHVAVAPVLANEPLSPGDHISLVGGRATKSGQTIGIVDPFLEAGVHRGDKFWMFMYPETVTGLRHEWDHPAFVEPEPEPETPDFDDSCRGC